MKCPKCTQPAIRKEIICFKSSTPFVQYTHAPDVIIGQFALVDQCLVIFPTKEELQNEH